jgi:alkylation response protein AidB-like acyl-CoA dehydrogenase
VPAPNLNPTDLYGVRNLLSDEERMVQDSVARMVDEKVLPIIRRHFEDHTFPRELVGELAALGLLGSSLEGYGCAGMKRRRLWPDLPGTRAGRLGTAQLRVGAVEPLHVPDPHIRQTIRRSGSCRAWRRASSSAASASPSRKAAPTPST